jgi:hypothetical protein
VHLPALINSSRRAESCLPLPASRSKVAEVDGDEENTDLELAYLELFALFAAPKLGEAEDGVLVLMIELRHLIFGRAIGCPSGS